MTTNIITNSLMMLALLCITPAFAQRHPPEIRNVYPLGGSAGATTRVTLTGVSFRNTVKLLFDRPGISAMIVPQTTLKLPPPTLDSDGNPEVIADIMVAKTAAPGVCRFRVVSSSGVSDAGYWMIGRDIAQSEEKEPNNDNAQAQAVALPLAINGRISDTGDVDTYRFDLKAGQPFVAEVTANRVGSPLDSILTLKDANGREVASNDDHNGPDSLLVYTPKVPGRYFLTLASSDGQGGPNFTYRLEMGILPLLLSTFPTIIDSQSSQGAQQATIPALSGVNLSDGPPTALIQADAGLSTLGAMFPRMTSAFVVTVQGRSNGRPVPETVLPILTNKMPGSDRLHAMLLPTPCVVNGRFWRGTSPTPGDKIIGKADVTFYKFRGEAGQRYLIDVLSQLLDSSAYPILSLAGPDGKMIMENDGTNGHNAHLDTILPQTGDYTLRVAELRQQSGPDLVYSLVIQMPPPGFSLTTETRARAVGQGSVVPIEVTVTRDRWDGPVVLGLRDLPGGVTATTCIVPAGVGRGLLLLTADKTAPLTDFPLHIIGTGQIMGTTVQHLCDTATDWIWKGAARANVPAPAALIDFAVCEPVEIMPQTELTTLSIVRGQNATLKVKLVRQAGYVKPITLHVLGLPDGVTAADVVVTPDKPDAMIEIKVAATARLGAATIAVSSVVTQSQFVLLDRATPAIMLTITDPPKKK